MADYTPPTENLPIFDNLVFISGDEPLTYNIAKKRFLRYPNAQGTENLQAITVNGTAQFNNTSEFNNTATFNGDIITRDPSTSQTGEIFQSGSSTNIRANGGGYVYLWTGGAPTATFQPTLAQFDTDIILRDPATNQTGEIFQDGSSTNIRANNGGYIYLWSGGAITTTLQPTLAQFDTNITVRDPVSGNQIYALPNSSVGSFNPVVQAGDETIVASGTQNAETLTLTTSSTTTNGLRITPTSATLGYGGTSSTPSSRIVCDATNVSIAPSLKYTDNTIQNSAFTGAGLLAGSYTNTNLTIDSNGRITALANGTSGSTNKTYSASYFGSSIPIINIPANCYKFDIVVIGTGGLAGTSFYTSASNLQVGGAGGGGQVVRASGIQVPPSDRGGTTSGLVVSINYFYPGTTISGTSVGWQTNQVPYNFIQLGFARNGLSASGTTGGLGGSGSNSGCNSSIGVWTYNDGSQGQNGFSVGGSPPVFTSGPVGGGAYGGGVIGYPQYTDPSTTPQQYGQGQRNTAITSLYGNPSYPASQINYGGVIITWYIL